VRTKKYKTFTWKSELVEMIPLDLFLVKKIYEDAHIKVSRKECKSSIENSDITAFINKRKVFKSSTKVSLNDHIKIDIALSLLKKHSTEDIKNKVELRPEDIIWEDRWLLVARKPKGIPSLQTLDPKRDNFLAAVKRLLVSRGERDPYLVLHHRLDVETSGVMLFCKKKSLNKKVGELFSQRKIQKTYHALCSLSENQETPNKAWETKNYLKKSDARPLKMNAVLSGGDFAHTSFKVLEKYNETILIEARPHTGRTHQIRVHLAGLDLPIVNDSVYGPSEKSATNNLLCLHAVSLEFIHPETKEHLKISAPLD
jgi:RluA family pseudouridine synthase